MFRFRQCTVGLQIVIIASSPCVVSRVCVCVYVYVCACGVYSYVETRAPGARAEIVDSFHLQ